MTLELSRKMFNRLKFNQQTLIETLEYLRYDDPNNLIKAFLNTCYLVEQVVKKNLRDKNPLLYYDNRLLSDPHNKVSAYRDEPTCKIYSIGLEQAIKIFNELNPQYEKMAPLFEELRLARNEIIHSTNTIIETPFSYADLTAKILIELMPAIKMVCEKNSEKIIVETKKDLVKRQKKLLQKAKRELREKIDKHQGIYRSLVPGEIKTKLKNKTVFESTETFISSERPMSCPACGEVSLEEISMVDFDIGDEGEVFSSGTSYFKCKVCEVELSESQLESLR